MGRILCIDYGRRRCGIAVTDILHICANGLPTVPTPQILDFITGYTSREEVEEIVVGKPLRTDGEPSDSMRYIRPFLGNLKKRLPNMKITLFDERFTSTIAKREMIAGGVSMTNRREERGLVDKTAAVLILTGYLESLKPLIP